MKYSSGTSLSLSRGSSTSTALYELDNGSHEHTNPIVSRGKTLIYVVGAYINGGYTDILINVIDISSSSSYTITDIWIDDEDFSYLYGYTLVAYSDNSA